MNNIKSVKNKSMNRESGQLLIESMVGISIAIVGLLGVVTLLSKSVGINRVVSQQFAANYLAAEGIEITKSLIDSNIIRHLPWNQGLSTGSYEADYASSALGANQERFLLVDGAGFYGYQSGEPSLFKRTIYIELIGPDQIKVNSIVRWGSRGASQFEINAEDRFFNWRL